MKKVLIVSAVVLITVAALGIAGFAYAQSQTPPAPFSTYGPGMMNGGWSANGGQPGGMMSGFSWAGNGTYGPMHEYMVASLAKELGLSAEEVEALKKDGIV